MGGQADTCYIITKHNIMLELTSSSLIGVVLPYAVAAGAVGFSIYRLYSPKKPVHINPDIKKDQDKVADVVFQDDLGETTAFCRCWRSKKFPYCDGSHNAYNKETGDNTGPVVIKKKKPEPAAAE